MRGAEYSELAAFVAVAQERSFRRAARRLGLSPSALSHTIRELEERLGARLLNRTTRSVAPTEAGTTLLDRLAPAFSDIGAAVDALSDFRDTPSGTVLINLPKLAADIIFTPIFGRFAADYPDIRLELRIDDYLTDIVAAGFDAGIRPGERIERDMVAVRLTPDLPTIVVGSPAYFETHKPPLEPRDLRDHVCINYRWTRSGALYRWPFIREGEALDVAVEGVLTINDSDLVVAAALRGAGLLSTLKARVADHVAAGRLIPVLQDWSRPFPGLFLYYPGRRQMPVALRTLIDFLRGEARLSGSNPIAG